MRPNNTTAKASLTERFSGLVWKVMVHRSGVLAVETRNIELKQVLFSAYNYITGETYFKEKGFKENWNLSLAFAGEENLILIGYKHTETPESKGVFSVNIKDGNIFWQKFDISLNKIKDDALQVYDPRIQPKKYSWINHKTAALIAEPNEVKVDSEIIFPEVDNSFVIPAFVEHGRLVGELLILHFADKVFLSFHETEKGLLRQRIVVYQDDKVIIDDILISGIQKLQPEAFFIHRNHLFYIRGKEEMVTYLV
ncbi:DUF4905 domain-containing protein [Daejeonella sp.]|uniref:DUF4905 domain-containing protein n=1 Tax=Daejeonella sp. TaxID=2805397 RepID=UPI0039830182